jgi:hypothetical protein
LEQQQGDSNVKSIADADEEMRIARGNSGK